MGGLIGIEDVCAIYKIDRPALLLYEAEGLLKPNRLGSMRLYRPADRLRIELILKGLKLGFSLAEIKMIVSHFDA